MSGRGPGRSKKPHSSIFQQAEAQVEVFKRFVEISGQALGMSDIQGRIFFANLALCRMMGVEDTEDIYHLDIFTFYTPETARRLHEEILPIVLQQGQWIGELRFMSKQGHTTPIIENIFLIRDDTGMPLCFATVITDISERLNMEKELHVYRDHLKQIVSQHTAELEKTNALLRKQIAEQKRTEEALQESESKYRLLHSSMRDAFASVDLEGTIREFNGAYVDMLGYKPEELKKLTYQDITPEKWHAYEAEILEKQVFQMGYSVIYEKEYRRKDGTVFPVELRTVLLRDDAGIPTGMWAIVRDISERKQTEEALKESLDILAEAERIGHMGSWKRDLTTDDIVWSAGTYRIMGFSENEKITFEQFKSRIHPDDLDGVLWMLQDTAGKGTPHSTEFRIILPEGSIRHVAGRAEASLDPKGKPVLLHGTIQDITERKIFEDELIRAQRLDTIGTLVGGLAHDYNNLLTAIMGNIELAKMHIPETHLAHALLAKAEKVTVKARDLTQHLITFSLGGYPMIKVIPARDLIIQSVKLALSGSSTNSFWKIANDLPEVKADENQIRQVIHNIVINATEAMPGGGTLFIEADKTFLGPENDLFLAEGTYVRLVFRDEGRGISEENLPRIFDPYFTTKDLGKTKGMGLGLSICYSIIKRHGGHIIVTSKEGTGTTITIYIPAESMK